MGYLFLLSRMGVGREWPKAKTSWLLFDNFFYELPPSGEMDGGVCQTILTKDKRYAGGSEFARALTALDFTLI